MIHQHTPGQRSEHTKLACEIYKVSGSERPIAGASLPFNVPVAKPHQENAPVKTFCSLLYRACLLPLPLVMQCFAAPSKSDQEVTVGAVKGLRELAAVFSKNVQVGGCYNSITLQAKVNIHWPRLVKKHRLGTCHRTSLWGRTAYINAVFPHYNYFYMGFSYKAHD